VQAFVAGADDGVLPQGNPGITERRVSSEPGRPAGARPFPIFGRNQGLTTIATINNFNDVVQANLGDCAFMAAVGALAEEDWNHITNMITDKGNGLYDVKLYKDGKWSTYEIDGSLDRGMDMAALTGDFDTQTGNAEIWPILLEKAFAAMFGGYDNIEGRSVSDAWRALTGKGVTSSSTVGKSDDQVFQDIANPRGQGKQVIVDTKSTWPAQLPKNVRDSLVPNHSYVVTGYVTDQTGAVTKVKLHNPWGKNHVQLEYQYLSEALTSVHAVDPVNP